MYISNLWENVSSRTLLLYLVPTLIVALVLIVLTFFWSGNTKLFIVCFALFVFIWSLWFSENKNRLPKEKVDFWYYTLAILGVVLFFSVQTNQRERILLVIQYIEAEEAILSTQKQKKFLESIFGQYKQLMSDLIFANYKLTEKTKQILDDCPAQQQFESFEMRENPLLNAFCMTGMKDLSFHEKIAKAENLQQIETAIKEYSLEDGHVNLRERNLSWQEVIEVLRAASDPREHAAQLLSIDEKIKAITAIRDATQSQFQNIGTDIIKQQSFIASVPNRLASFVWPYLLIIALGMKLARTRYT